MIAFFGIVSLVGAGLILPGWILARRQAPQGLWLFALPLGGTMFWLLLTVLDVGAQSLANIIEVYAVAGIAVLAAYLKFFVFDRFSSVPGRSVVLAVAIVAVVTLGLRLFMPGLPE